MENFPAHRETCYRCFWPKSLCWCPTIQPMPTRTRIVFLMHPKEYKQEKSNTGRLTHLALDNSAIHVGIAFDDHAPTQELLADPRYAPHLLYPGPTAHNLTHAPLPPEALGDRTLLIFIIDGTWSCARKMLKLSPSLQRLPRVMFTPTAPSRYLIKQQPQPGCLSTLEATHELLLALTAQGLDTYEDPAQLLNIFARMQDFQIRCASDPARAGYRHHPYKLPADRIRTTAAKTTTRRRRYLPSALRVLSAPANPTPEKNLR